MDGCRQNVLDSNSKKVIDAIDKSTVHFPSPQKLGIAGNQIWQSNFASQTPEKTNQSLNAKPKEAEVELLERHKAIIELFDSMTCSLRLLGLRKKSPTFQNICTQVEVLTRRKFSHGHLAQLKYLLHEAIQIDKILVHDKKTLCMKPEMEIILLFNEIAGHHEQSDFIALHQLFASRLINYFTVHPEACDIPEAILPDPFNQSKRTAFGGEVSDIPEVLLPEPLIQSQTFVTEQLLANASTEDLPTTVESEPPSKSSHMHPSFSRHFSEKIITEKDKTQLLTSSVPLSSVLSNMKNQDAEISKTTEHPDPSSKSDSETNLDTKYEQAKESPGTNSTSTSINPIPIQAINPQFSINTNACGSPMWKLASSSADNLMVETPAQSTPKRATPLSDDNHKGVASQKQASSSCTAAKRSLDFSLLEGNESACCEFLPDNISQTVDGSSAILQKVDGSFGCDTEELKMSPSDFLHQQISVYLPRLVSLIHRIFQSVNYSTITKEELVHKIIVNSFDFDERRQVEEQIEILEKLVPDWICMKLAPSGDVLYCIKKASDLNSVQSRVAMIKSN